MPAMTGFAEAPDKLTVPWTASADGFGMEERVEEVLEEVEPIFFFVSPGLVFILKENF